MKSIYHERKARVIYPFHDWLTSNQWYTGQKSTCRQGFISILTHKERRKAKCRNPAKNFDCNRDVYIYCVSLFMRENVTPSNVMEMIIGDAKQSQLRHASPYSDLSRNESVYERLCATGPHLQLTRFPLLAVFEPGSAGQRSIHWAAPVQISLVLPRPLRFRIKKKTVNKRLRRGRRRWLRKSNNYLSLLLVAGETKISGIPMLFSVWDLALSM